MVKVNHGFIDVSHEYIISVEETEKALIAIKCQKSSGPDGLPNGVLCNFAGVLGGPVCAIWNNSIRSGNIPDIWKSANVSPIPKVTPPKQTESDLRPISLTARLRLRLRNYLFAQNLSCCTLHI